MRLFLDMDGVLADYDKHALERGIPLDAASKVPGFFLELPLMPGAKEAVLALQSSGKYELFVCSTPSWENPGSCGEKIQWLSKQFGKLFHKKAVLTSRKDLVGGINDILIDDHPEWSGAKNFSGKLLRFGDMYNWAYYLPRLLSGRICECQGKPSGCYICSRAKR